MIQKECEHKPLPLKPAEEALTPLANDESFFCDTCQRIFIGKLQWNAHMKSRRHKKVVQKQKQLEARKGATTLQVDTKLDEIKKSV